MKTITNYKILKETEKATLFKSNVEELNSEKEFWLPKSKYEQKDNKIEIEDDIWNDKLEELKNPTKEPSVILCVKEYEDRDSSYKLVLDAKLQKININPWFFIPKSIVQKPTELDIDDEEKYSFEIPVWFWEKNLNTLIENQLEFFNKEREGEPLQKRDFKLQNKLEE